MKKGDNWTLVFDKGEKISIQAQIMAWITL